MKTEIVNLGEIEKSDGLVLNPKFYLKAKPYIQKVLKENAVVSQYSGVGLPSIYHPRLKWVDKLDYGSAAVLYAILKEVEAFRAVKQTLKVEVEKL